MFTRLSIFTVFLKNRNFISKSRISEVTDYAALTYCNIMQQCTITLHPSVKYNLSRAM